MQKWQKYNHVYLVYKINYFIFVADIRIANNKKKFIMNERRMNDEITSLRLQTPNSQSVLSPRSERLRPSKGLKDRLDPLSTPIGRAAEV